MIRLGWIHSKRLQTFTMADDLDAELLALAGDDASDEETSPLTKQTVDSPRPSQSRSPEPSSSMGRKGTAKTVRRSRKTRKDDDEDGEAYVFFHPDGDLYGDFMLGEVEKTSREMEG